MKRETLHSLRGVAIEPTYLDLLREKLDVHEVVARLAAVGANCVRFGAISHNGRAYYPSSVMPRARGLRERDLVLEFADACEERGMVLGIYSNSMYAERSIARLDWATRINGEPLTVGGTRLRFVSHCHLSPYFDRWLEATREIVDRYRPAFYYIDCFQVMPGCTCRFCRRKLRDETGFSSPPNEGKARWQAYCRWIERNSLACAKRAFDAVKETNSETLVVWNRGTFRGQAGYFPEEARRFSTTVGDGYHLEAAVRFYGERFFHIDEQAMIAEAVGTPAFIWVEYPRMPWSHLASPAVETRIKAAKVFAGGARPMMWSYPAAPLGDQRGLAGVGAVYQLAGESPELFENTEPVADTAVLFSTSTSRWYPGTEEAATGMPGLSPALDYATEFSGLLESLLISHTAVSVVLEDGDLSGIRVLVLPNAACMSSRLCGRVRRFVRAGGGLVATYETSLYDENGLKRRDFGLADVFGVSCEKDGPRYAFVKTDVAGGAVAGYMRVPADSDLFGDLSPGSLFPVGGKTLWVRPKRGTDVPGELVAPTRYYCDFPGALTGRPGAVVHRYGKGACVYLPWQAGRTYGDHGLADVQRLIGAAAGWVRQRRPLIETDLPDTVTVTLRRTRSADVVVHLVNLSTDPTRDIRSVAPVRGAHVAVRLRGLKRAYALVARANLRAERAHGALRIALPEIGPHEVVHLT